MSKFSIMVPHLAKIKLARVNDAYSTHFDTAKKGHICPRDLRIVKYIEFIYHNAVHIDAVGTL